VVIGATWQIQLNLCFFGPLESTTQMANRSVQPFLHSSRQKVSILYNRRPFPQNCPFSWGDLDRYLIDDSLGQSEPTIRMASRSVQLLSHRDRNVLILYNWTPLSPSKLPLPTGGSGPPSNTCSLGPSKSSTQTISRPVQPFLQGSLV